MKVAGRRLLPLPALVLLGSVGFLAADGAGDPATPDRPTRVVVIDPGHGGADTGAVGPGGIQEKAVALGVARRLRDALEAREGYEVHLTRDADVHVPLWERGEMATRWKGDRPGIFVSIHANALPGRRQVRGFETYFLAEARTEHERRVAAMENAPLALDASGADGAPLASDPFLNEILMDLRSSDHQRWSAHLAELVQEELGRVHPGPDRGVKQGPFAVITNALMPAVLVEVGFITHADEARLLGQPSFHRGVATSLAAAIDRFFARYPGAAAGERGGSPAGGGTR